MAVVTEGQLVAQEKKLLSWKTKSRPFRKNQDMQSRQVLMVLGVLVAMVLGFAGEWMLLAVLVAGAFYYYAINFTPPGEEEFQLTTFGVRAFGKLFGWNEFSRWWWSEKWTTKLLSLELVTGVMGRIYIPVAGVKPEEVEKVMNKYLLFNTPKETSVEKMTKWVTEKFPLENKV